MLKDSLIRFTPRLNWRVSEQEEIPYNKYSVLDTSFRHQSESELRTRFRESRLVHPGSFFVCSSFLLFGTSRRLCFVIATFPGDLFDFFIIYLVLIWTFAIFFDFDCYAYIRMKLDFQETQHAFW